MPSVVPDVKILNRLKYYEYQQGLISRHLNQGGGWDSHLDKCRNFILSVIKEKKPPVVTVLGSGWLLELPLAEMVEEGIRVRLVDIVHPPEVRKQTAIFENVTLLEEDLSGGLAEIAWEKYNAAPVLFKKKGFPEFEIPLYIPAYDPGMIISLNLITQLELLPLRALEKRYRFDSEEALNFRRKVQEQHLAFLRNHSFILISDVSERSFFKDNTEQLKDTLLVSLPECRKCGEWTWDFDLAGADYFMKKSQFTVKAMYCE